MRSRGACRGADPWRCCSLGVGDKGCCCLGDVSPAGPAPAAPAATGRGLQGKKPRGSRLQPKFFKGRSRARSADGLEKHTRGTDAVDIRRATRMRSHRPPASGVCRYPLSPGLTLQCKTWGVTSPRGCCLGGREGAASRPCGTATGAISADTSESDQRQPAISADSDVRNRY